MHPAAMDIEALLRRCETRRGRASGPGGQHRNKVETAVWLRDKPTGVEASASERRSQQANHKAALFRLRVNLAIEERGYFDLGKSPSGLWASRLKGTKLSINPTHDDFPAILAEAMDVLAALGNDPAKAAKVMGCSATQLVKLLRHEPKALGRVNASREAKGLHALR